MIRRKSFEGHFPNNSFYLNPSNLGELRVDRVDEINSFLNTLLQTNHNLYLFGERGVGKTFLTKLLYHQLKETDQNVFPFFLNLFSLSRDLVGQSERVFSSLLALELIRSIWVDIYERPHSDLIRNATEDSDITFRKKHIFLQRMYSDLRASTIKRRNDLESDFGVKTVLTASNKSLDSDERSFDQLLPFEILSYIEEIRDFLIKKEKKMKLIALCDEANLMSIEWQKEVLSKHVDIFSNLHIQFVFVAGLNPNETEIRIPDSFQSIIELKGIPEEFVNELIHKYYPQIKFHLKSSVLKELMKTTKGNPREILWIAHKSIQSDLTSKEVKITKSDIEEFKVKKERMEKELKDNDY